MAKILLVNNAEPGMHEFVQSIEVIIKKFGSSSFTIEYEQCIGFNFFEFDGIILSGSPQGNDIVEHHLPYFQWIKEINKPVLGICAGHHIIGVLYGSDILRNTEAESGICDIRIVKNDFIVKSLPLKIKVQQMHNDSVTLPNDFELLATSGICKNQFMKHKNKPVYSSQFHPEFYNHKIIRNFLTICDNKTSSDYR